MSTVTETNKKPLLEVKGLKQYFPVSRKFTVKAVEDVSFYINPGETYGLVGESGSGKTTIGRALIRLYDPTAGQITFDGMDISGKMSRQTEARLRSDMQMIFQDPMACLNPRQKVADIIAQGLDIHHRYHSQKERTEMVADILHKVGLAPEHANRYPHQFSGGQRQRVGIARALVMNPKLIIADECISALDMSIQAQVVNLMKDIQDETGLAYLFIAHALSMVKYISDRIGVLHLGYLLETGTTEEIFSHPAHPYTIGLMASKPVVGRQVDKLYSIPGKVPNPINMPNYCYFKDRCEMCVNGCEGDYPCEVSISPTHKVSCYRYYDGKRPDLEEVVEEELAEGKENGKEGE